MGIVKILIETKLPLSLSMVIARSVQTFGKSDHPISVNPNTEKRKQVIDFILERARFVF